MLQYDFVPGKVPDRYKPVPWTDKLERIPNDYGAPVSTRNQGFASQEEEKQYWDNVLSLPEITF